MNTIFFDNNSIKKFGGINIMKKTFLFFGIAACLYTLSVIFVNSVTDDVSDNILRLHIIANSNSELDQEVKLKVRNAVLKADICLDDEMLAVKNLRRLEAEANNILFNNGFSYGAKADFGEFYFPEKTYADTTIPEGTYKSVKLILGEGGGKNWWCITSTPVYLIDGSVVYDTSILETKLNKKTFAFISEKNKYKLKFIEWVQGIF